MVTRKVRNANVELLRIVSMLFIIMHHCVINGYGLQEQLKSGIVNGGVQHISVRPKCNRCNRRECLLFDKRILWNSLLSKKTVHFGN